MMTRTTVIAAITLASTSGLCQELRKVAVGEGYFRDSAYVYPVSYDSNHYHGLVRNELPDGKWVAYYDDGSSIAFIGFYLRGKPNGIFQHFFRNGRVRHTCVYVDGVQDGPFTYWDESGSVNMIGQKVAGMNEGDWYEWYPNGRQRKFEQYREDKQDGVFRYYYSNGQLDTEGRNSNGFSIGEWRSYHKNGRPRYKRFYVEQLGTKELAVVAEYENTIAHVSFPVGHWVEWDDSGNTTEELFFDDHYDLLRSVTYYSSGGKRAETHYKGFVQGYCSMNPSRYLRNGEMREWYESGQLRCLGIFKDEERDGEWTYWKEDGEVERHEVYEKGILIESR